MQITMTGNILLKNPNRMAGTYQIAYAVTTPSGKTGTALFHYEYDKRDIMVEMVYTTEEIAAEVRAFIGDDSPSCFGQFAFPKPENENQHPENVIEAVGDTTELVFGYDG